MYHPPHGKNLIRPSNILYELTEEMMSGMDDDDEKLMERLQ